MAITVVTGSEELLVARACQEVKARARGAQPDLELIAIEAAAYGRGQLAQAVSPSLFGNPRLVEVSGWDRANEALAQDLESYAAHPEPDIWLLVRHSGNHGRKAVAALAKAGEKIEIKPLKYSTDKVKLVMSDVRAAGRQITSQAAQALVDALGSDVAELASATAQLIADTQGRIDLDAVQEYHGQRVEATGFQIADAAATGQVATALALTRHALNTGLDPILIISALGAKLRTLAKVSGLSSPQDAPGAGIAPWQYRQARAALSHWDDPSLASAIRAVARADHAVKGASKAPHFVLEQTITEIAQAAARKPLR